MSSKQVRTAFVFGPRDIQVVTRAGYPLEPDEVRIAVAQYGICDSDVRRWASPPEPAQQVQLGHEFVGTVTEVGHGAGRRSVGERAIAWVASRAGTPRVRGFAQEIVVQERHCFPVTADCRFPFLAEPLGRLMSTLALPTIRWSHGGHVVIVGGGFKALLATMLIAQHNEPQSLTVVTSRADAIQLATQVGATDTASSPAELRSVIGQATDGRGADVVFDLTGTQPGLDLALRSAREGGKVAVGRGWAGPREVNDDFLQERGIRMIKADPIHAANRHWMQLALGILDTSFDPTPIMGSSFPLARIAEAFEQAERGVRKVIVTP